jgi:hypothetical protein
MDLAMGDLDGDGRMELGLVVGDTLAILRRSAAGAYSLLYSRDFRDGKHEGDWATTNWYVRAEAGDVNGDGRDEFVAMSGYWYGPSPNTYAAATYQVVGGAGAAELYNGIVSDESGSAEILFGNLAIGDLDGDGVEEICFTGISNRTQNTLLDFKVITAWWTGSGFRLPGGKKTLSHSLASADYNQQYRPLPTSCYKPRLGRAEALFTLNRVVEWKNGALEVTAKLPEDPTLNPYYFFDFEQLIATGDVDRDGLDDIVALYIGATKTLTVYPGCGAGSGVPTLAPKATVANDTTTPYGVGSRGVYMSLCLPDWDGDAVTLSFIGSEVKYTAPKVVAVIAGPPYWADLVDPGSLANYSTSYGTTQGESYERVDTFSVAVDVSYMEGMSEAGFTAEYGGAVGASFAYAKGYSRESVLSTEETTIAGEDKVIYMSVPLDVYRYRILSSPNAAAVGTIYEVGVPRLPQLRAMERNAFNALPENPAVVDAAFLDHRHGDPFSYLSKAAMRAELVRCGAGFWHAAGKSVGRSGSPSTLGVEASTTTGDGFAVGGSISLTGRLGAIWRTVEVTATYAYEWNSTVSASTGSYISGTVPDLPPGTPLNRDFDFGLGLFSKPLPSQADPVLVITYWVEP